MAGQIYSNFRKFAQRIEREQNLANSEVQIISKTSISESECKFVCIH